MKYVLLLLSILSFSSFGETTLNKGTLTLDGDNFFAINRQFNESLADDFLIKVFTYTKDTMYLYFDSPGGDVMSMMSIVRQIENSKIKFICIVKEAASAAFMTFQYCNERYILPDGYLMAHNASGGFEGELPRIRERLDTFETLLKNVEKHIAKRLKISYNNYRNLASKELWLTQRTAIDSEAADYEIKNVTCSKQLTETDIYQTQTIQTILGFISQTVKRSGCPLINATQVIGK